MSEQKQLDNWCVFVEDENRQVEVSQLFKKLQDQT